MVELKLRLKATEVFKTQRATRIPSQYTRTSKTLIRHTNFFAIIAPVNTNSLTTRHTFMNTFFIHKKAESLKIVLHARQLNTIIDETMCGWPIELIQIIHTLIKGPVFSIADMNSAYNQMPLDKPSQRLTNFVIKGQQYRFKLLF